MYNYHQLTKEKQLSLSIPGKLLASDLSPNKKYILGLDFALLQKSGSNSYLHTEVGKLLNLHSNIIANSRRALVIEGLLEKNGRVYKLTQKALRFQEDDKGLIILPYNLYSFNNLSTGAKLLCNQNKLLKIYEHRNGYCSKQTFIVTCTFVSGKPDMDLNRVKDHNGNWIQIMPLLNP